MEFKLNEHLNYFFAACFLPSHRLCKSCFIGLQKAYFISIDCFEIVSINQLRNQRYCWRNVTGIRQGCIWL